MSLWEAEDFARDGAILRRWSSSNRADVVAILAGSEQGVYLTRDDVRALRDACDHLLAGGDG